MIWLILIFVSIALLEARPLIRDRTIKELVLYTILFGGTFVLAIFCYIGAPIASPVLTFGTWLEQVLGYRYP